MKAWMESKGHRANILEADYTRDRRRQSLAPRTGSFISAQVLPSPGRLILHFVSCISRHTPVREIRRSTEKYARYEKYGEIRENADNGA